LLNATWRETRADDKSQRRDDTPKWLMRTCALSAY
jgi:hypothetical protein